VTPAPGRISVSGREHPTPAARTETEVPYAHRPRIRSLVTSLDVYSCTLPGRRHRCRHAARGPAESRTGRRKGPVGISAAFTAEEIEALVRTAIEAVAVYSPRHVDDYQHELAFRAHRISVLDQRLGAIFWVLAVRSTSRTGCAG
jgi:hypothetical protein